MAACFFFLLLLLLPINFCGHNIKMKSKQQFASKMVAVMIAPAANTIILFIFVLNNANIHTYTHAQIFHTTNTRAYLSICMCIDIPTHIKYLYNQHCICTNSELNIGMSCVLSTLHVKCQLLASLYLVLYILMHTHTYWCIRNSNTRSCTHAYARAPP